MNEEVGRSRKMTEALSIAVGFNQREKEEEKGREGEKIRNK